MKWGPISHSPVKTAQTKFIKVGHYSLVNIVGGTTFTRSNVRGKAEGGRPTSYNVTHMIQTTGKMDNRDIDVVVPETTTGSLADGDGSDLEEEDVSKVPLLTVEYVTYNGASYIR